jgi:5-dehydro-2-deoxygluconokinase
MSLQHAARATGREWLLELIPPGGTRSDEIVLAAMRRFYEIGLKPDWWKLPPSTERETWKRIGDLLRASDPHARGVILLGLDSSEAELGRAFSASADEPVVRGFAVGRAIFWSSAERWFEGRASDQEAIAEVRSAFLRIVDRWRARRSVDPVELRAS